METNLETIAQWIASSKRVVAFTGAGMSTESGIPDFRSAGGLWTRFDPMEYATLGAFMRDPVKVWEAFAALEEVLKTVPNPGHYALARLEAMGVLEGIVTQNIDGLHQAAGSSHVVEYHGSHRSFSCLTCGERYPRARLPELGMPPRCTNLRDGTACQAVLKPDVVLFDEMIPPNAQRGASALVEKADLILVIGTSCEVYPAADLPRYVRNQGGKVVEVNLVPARHLKPDARLLGRSGELLPVLVEHIAKVKSSQGA